eukprot:PhM_4_TR17508/c2_g1_i3/m.942
MNRISYCCVLRCIAASTCSTSPSTVSLTTGGNFTTARRWMSSRKQHKYDDDDDDRYLKKEHTELKSELKGVFRTIDKDLDFCERLLARATAKKRMNDKMKKSNKTTTATTRKKSKVVSATVFSAHAPMTASSSVSSSFVASEMHKPREYRLRPRSEVGRQRRAIVSNTSAAHKEGQDSQQHQQQSQQRSCSNHVRV